MEDSLKGVLVALTLIGLFIISVVNFIFLFPQEQGFVFEQNKSDDVLELKKKVSPDLLGNLEKNKNITENAYSQWDITEGFMGSNQLKNSQNSLGTMIRETFSNFLAFSSLLFGRESPFSYALIILSSMSLGYLFYLFIKWIRTGV